MPNSILKWCLYSYVIIIPLIYFKGVESVFSITKLTSVRYITAILILSLVIKIYKEKKIDLIKNKFNILLLIYAVVSILTVVFSSHVYTSIYGSKSLFLGIITILNLILLAFFTFQYLSKKDINKIISLSVFTAYITGFIGILQHFKILNLEHWLVPQGQRAFSTFEHSNHFASYLVFNLFLAYSLSFKINSKFKKYLLLISSTVIYLSGIVFSGSRGALLALIFSLLSIMIFSGFQNRKNFLRIISKYKKIFASLVAITIVLFIISAVFSQTIFSKLSKLSLISRSIETVQFIRAGNVPDRISWYLSSLSMIKDKPLLGFGLNTYKENYNAYRRIDFANPHESQDNITPENAHNEYLTKAVEQGIIGLLVYLILIFYVVFNKNSIKYLQNSDIKEKYTYLFILGALISYIIQTFLSFGVISTLTLFYIFIGVAAKYALKDELEITEIPFSKFKKIIILFIPLMGIFLVYFGNKQFAAEYYSQHANMAFTQGKNIETIAYAEKMVAKMPKEYEYHRIYGDFLYQISVQESDFKKALDYLEKAEKEYLEALKINPTFPQLHANLGLIHFLQYLSLQESENKREAEKYLKLTKESYEEAIKYSPNNPLYTYNYAKLLMQIKDYNSAIFNFEKTFNIRPNYPGLAYHLAASYYLVADYEKALKVLEYSISHSTANQDQMKLYEGIKKILN
ncbi:MAG: hypothetical protein UR27_C0030G0001, partial [Candidatus Peregrinibacteria bacterium GW2011_GWA2_33_10]